MKTKVSIVKCKMYDQEILGPCVRQAFDFLGGISAFVNRGEKVLVKPNMLSGSGPEKGANTHVEVVRAVVKLVKECGAYPLIGDTPGGSKGVKETYESSGMARIAKEEGAELLETKDVKMIRGLPIASYFLECDKIISLPKMKTHNLMILTGAVKNMFGAVSGLNKSECHKRFPKEEEFCNVLVDVFDIVKPQLVLMDGVIAMDGDGPASGTLKSVGLLMASTDSVAIDTVFSYLVGMNPFKILTTKEAARRGLGEADIKRIDILGKKLEENLIRDFRLPHSKFILRLPNFLIRTLASFVKFGPYIDERLCKKCNICAETCPVSAITINKERSVIDAVKCIRCMCCHEVCPYNAVGLRRNILARGLGL